MKVAVLVLLAVLLGACQTTAVRDDRFVRFFDELTFGSGADGAADKQRTARRWEGPLEWTAEGSETFTRIAASRMDRIAGIAGRDSVQVRENGVIRFRQDPIGTAYPVQENLTSCFVRLSYAGDEIIRASIWIAEDTEERIIRCIDHEMMHALGFRFHSAAIASVMSPFHEQMTLSRWDIMALRALMSDRLQAGTPRNEALAEVERMFPALQAYADREASRTATN
ncbi:DUF2927 domain-containing protein [Thalassobaculum sp. OXR-137]|uniref:DUF2927 domain-containing protein n=1 Tax=Thalassobaculum sp. OXR-137 TaxID=3100173 RepID=UPI002AC98CF3|nr:DUF2927 domain-containing protein [Thalassobaculum sp. OXR-137]WPZ36366.1 DUF2927 domain-containing protein [Thalassobaculum sp. OXR-137]